MYFPGDSVREDIDHQIANVTVKGKPVEGIRLGPGLRSSGSCVYATFSGSLQYRPPNKFWLSPSVPRQRYVPHPGDLVIGRVIVRTADYYKVDTGSAHPAVLPCATGFEAATKRARPVFNPGAMVFGRISQADRYLEPEMVCVDLEGKTAGFGELAADRFAVWRVTLERAWQLQRPDCAVLNALGSSMQFEVVVGANGWVAVCAESPAAVLFIRQCVNDDRVDVNELSKYAVEKKK